MDSFLLKRWNSFLRYFDFPGNEPTLVFLHGLGCASTSDFPRMLRSSPLASHRSILPDFFGHGYSDGPTDFSYTLEQHAKTIMELLDFLKVKNNVLFGHSMGGSVAVTLATDRPDLVSRLILAEANLDPGGGFVSKGIATQTEEEFASTGHKLLIKNLLAAGFPTNMGTFQVAASHGLYLSAVGLVKGTTPTTREKLYKMTIPRAFIYGEKSLTPEETDPKILREHGVQVLIVPNARHPMMLDNSAGTAEAIKRAIN